MYMSRVLNTETPLLFYKQITSIPLGSCLKSSWHVHDLYCQQAAIQSRGSHIDTITREDKIRKRLYGDVEPVIGLEVHAQLSLKSKLFSQGGLSNDAPPNSQLDLFDVSLPGTLPKVNRRAVEFALRTGLALNCDMQDKFSFDRKNYFYADMPAGYQITQFDHPIAKFGHIDFIVTSYHDSLIAHSQQYDVVKYLYANSRLEQEEIQPYIRRSIVKQIQLEQDSAKTLQHIPQSDSDLDSKNERKASSSGEFSLIDYNRSGSALVEIVFEPDLTNHHEASALVKELILILRAIGTCDCELQEGSLRIDANVSIKRIDGIDISDPKRVELKNLNSLRALNRGIHREVCRQAEIIKSGGKIVQESRTYDSRSKDTKFLRLKETALDYRYMPEPSIPPINVDQQQMNRLKEKLNENELPAFLRTKLIKQYNMELTLVNEILEEPGLSDFLDAILSNNQGSANMRRYNPNVVADFLIYTIFNLKNLSSAILSSGKINLKDDDSEFRRRLSIETLQSILDMMFDEEISYATAYEVIKCIYVNNTKSNPREVVEHLGWYQINDMEEIDKHCTELIKCMKSNSKRYAKGNGRKYLRRLLDKLCELTNNKISVRRSIECLNSKLRPNDPKSSIGI